MAMGEFTPVVSGELWDAEVVVGTCVEDKSVEVTIVTGRPGCTMVIAET